MDANALANFQQKRDAIIDEYGWMVQGVFPTEDEPGPSFVYTVGLHAKGLPELLIYGLPLQAGGGILNTLAERAVENGEFLSGEILDDVLQNDLPIKVVDVTKDHECYQAEYYAGEKVRVQQVVWPDAEGRFPWEEGATDYGDDVQPLLFDA